MSIQILSVCKRITPKYALIAGGVSFLALTVIILTHIGTYTVTLAHSSSQNDVQMSVAQIKKQIQPKNDTRNASKTLIRINQNNIDQYSNQQEHNIWSPSACSAATITELINSYGHNYKITDILKIESGLGAITPNEGLLYPEGIDQTAAKFGFDTQTLKSPTLEQILTIANGGQPIIVNFPPQTYPGGHFLIVLGSINSNGTISIHLADSSALNMQYMAQNRFLSYWKGLAKVLTPKTSINQYAITEKPTLTASFINQVLQAYNSPAQGKGQALYDLGIQDDIDPAFALAFFFHESTLGTKGEATTTLSLGNLRCIQDAACINTQGQTCQTGESCYAGFKTWDTGFKAWYDLILKGYIQGEINQSIGHDACPCTTISTIIPIYAPASDKNDEEAYINSLKHALDVWHSGQLRP